MSRVDPEAYLRAWNTTEPSVSLNDPSTSLVEAISYFESGPETASGVRVSPETALRYIAVFAAVRYLAESIGSLPMKVYRKEGRSRIEVSEADDRRAYLLGEEPNPFQGAMTFWETLIGHANLWGNAYALIEFDRLGVAKALWPLDPRTTAPYRAPDGSLWYGMATDAGTVALSPREVLHIRAFGTGDVGISPIGVARQAIGEQLAAEDYAGRFWTNDATPGGVIQYAKRLDDEKHGEAVRRWNSMHQGLRRKHLVAVLDNGAEWKDVGVPQRDAQFLESRKWGYRQIAAAFRVPPHKIGDLEGNVTFASIDAQELSAVVDSLRPWAVRTEQAVKRTIFPTYINVEKNELTPDGRARKYAAFTMDALLRGDVKTRHLVYASGRQWGYYSANDVLEMEDRPGIGENGDVYLQPVNMVPAGTNVLDAAGTGDGAGDNSARALAAIAEKLGKLGATDASGALARAVAEADAELRSK